MKGNLKKILSIVLPSITIVSTAIITPTVLTSCSPDNTNEVHDSTFISSQNSNYIKNNSVSLCFVYSIDWDSTLNAIRTLFKDKEGIDNNERLVLNDIYNQMDRLSQYSSFQFGTGWIIDSVFSNSSPLVDYYVATNEHVTNLTFQVENTKNSPINYNFKLPVAPFAKITNFYIAQPINDEVLWYPGQSKSKYIKLSNKFPDIINFASPSGYSSLNNLYQSVLVGSIGIGFNQKQYNFVLGNKNHTPSADLLDMSILHFKSVVDYWPNKNKNLIKMFSKPNIYANPNDYMNETYITKLYLANQDLKNNDLASFKKHFPFASSDVWNNSPTINVAGYPATNNNYTYINSATTNKLSYSINTSARPTVEFSNHWFISTANYPQGCTIGAKDVDLGGGSSGSMVLDNNNQIVGIYWGVLSNNSYKWGLLIPFVNNMNPEYSLLNLLYQYYKTIQQQQKSPFTNSLLWSIFSNPIFPFSDYNITK